MTHSSKNIPQGANATKRMSGVVCAVLAVTAFGLLPLAEAQAQKRGSISSTKTMGKKKGGVTIYKPHKLATEKRRERSASPKRRNAIRISDSQITLNARLNAKVQSQPSVMLSRAPLGPSPKPKIDTSRMSMDVNTTKGPRSKPINRAKRIKPPAPTGPPPPLPKRGN